MSRITSQILVVLGIMSTVLPCVGGLSPHNVAVIVNELSAESKAVGRYYCANAGIPLANLIELRRTPTNEAMNSQDYATLAADIRSALVNQIGVDPEDWANDPIQCLVLCYGVPVSIDYGTSVDSWLTLLFNNDPDRGPGEPGVVDRSLLPPATASRKCLSTTNPGKEYRR